METMTLTARQVDVLRLLAIGCSYSQIADRLRVEMSTVTTHITRLYRKLDVHSAGAAVARGIQLGVVKQDQADPC
jgi:DNA-binding NarL/FixJ family response regulator